MSTLLGAPVAAIDTRRQLLVIDRDGRPVPQTSGAGGLLWGAWDAPDAGDVHSWPTWSPDGRRVAAFRIARDGSGNRVLVTEVEGIEAQELCDLSDRVPIYLRWSPDGAQLAVLSQADSKLQLEVVPGDGSGPPRPTLRGSPLFFTWLPDQRIAAFVGEEDGPHMAIVAPTTGKRRDLPGTPGNFCTPIPVGDELAYVAHQGGRVVVMLAPPDSNVAREIEEIEGLAALMVSPDQRTVARAVDPSGSGTSYRSLELIEVATGDARPVTDLDSIAFLWSPTGDALVVARHDETRGRVTWVRVGLDGSTRTLAELEPTRDMRFYLRFFEQYGVSHPIIDPAGETLLLAGKLPNAPRSDGLPHLWAVPMDGGSTRDLGPGMFGVFGPGAPATPEDD